MSLTQKLGKLAVFVQALFSKSSLLFLTKSLFYPDLCVIREFEEGRDDRIKQFFIRKTEDSSEILQMTHIGAAELTHRQMKLQGKSLHPREGVVHVLRGKPYGFFATKHWSPFLS